jgi:hypothetical protein
VSLPVSALPVSEAPPVESSSGPVAVSLTLPSPVGWGSLIADDGSEGFVTPDPVLPGMLSAPASTELHAERSPKHPNNSARRVHCMPGIQTQPRPRVAPSTGA